MADQSSQEKTEDATPKRLREARKKGQVVKSRDISTVLVLIVGFATLAFSLGYMGGEYKRLFQLAFELISNNQIDGSAIWNLGKACLIAFGKTLAPILLASMFMGFFSGVIQVGALFATDPLTPKLEKLNPIEGLKNMFKVVTFIELIKNIFKIAIVLWLAYTTIADSIDAVLNTSRIDVLSSAKITGSLLFEFMIKVCIAFLIISILDYGIQRWNFMKNMKMSKDEVKREYKQDEGDPAIKGERRRLHREMAFSDAKGAVRKSDAVVTNPTHVACAIEYNKEEMGAPILTIKGQRNFAEVIIQYAREENIPIIRNIPLAWSLVHLEEGDEIPEDLYEAVAEILMTVYEMKDEIVKFEKQ